MTQAGSTPFSNLGEILSSVNLAEVRRLELKAKRNVTSNLAGQYRSTFHGSGLVFHDIREYTPGDDVKHIHWKVTARSGKTYVKSYEEDRELNVLLALDISRSTLSGGGKSHHQRSLEFCALIAMLAKVNQDAIGLCLFDDAVREYIPASRKRTQVRSVLSELIKARELKPATDLKEGLKFLNQNIRRHSIIFLISDYFSSPYNDQLKLLSMKHEVICVKIHDFAAQEMPKAGIVEYIDAESGERILFDSSNARLRELLRKRNQGVTEEWIKSCAAANTDYMLLRQYPIKDLAELLHRRNRKFR